MGQPSLGLVRVQPQQKGDHAHGKDNTIIIPIPIFVRILILILILILIIIIIMIIILFILIILIICIRVIIIDTTIAITIAIVITIIIFVIKAETEGNKSKAVRPLACSLAGGLGGAQPSLYKKHVSCHTQDCTMAPGRAQVRARGLGGRSPPYKKQMCHLTLSCL